MPKKKFNKIIAKRNDINLALLTETLPYETPLPFSNDHFYVRVNRKDDKYLEEKYKLGIFAIEDKKSSTTPYRFKIKKNNTEYRTLAVMHPTAQLRISAFYSQYDQLICSLCQRSSASLRAPASVAKFYYEKARAESVASTESTHVEEMQDGFAVAQRHASSYFAYRNYSLLYKFIDSAEFLELEKRYSHLLRLDISQCFGRIYTHSIAWAVKNRNYAKANISAGSNRFEDFFDRAMQRANDNETAGVIVGPEVSRIFSEIILQRIDLDVEDRLSGRGLRVVKDYCFKRYVDDYFIFAHSKNVLELIETELGLALECYKLSLNKGKSELWLRPYSFPESIGRAEIKDVVSNFFLCGVKKKKNSEGEVIGFFPERASLVSRSSAKLIWEIKKILSNCNVPYSSVSGYLFGALVRRLRSYFNKLKIASFSYDDEENAVIFICEVVDVAFFCYSMCMRARQTYQLCKIIDLIGIGIAKFGVSNSMQVREKVAREIILIFGSSNGGEIHAPTETLNLLFALKLINPEQKVPEQLILRNYFPVHDDSSGLEPSYFEAMSVLAYIESSPIYDKLRAKIFDGAVSRINNTFEWNKNAELCFMYLDLISCPYIDEDKKVEMVRMLFRKGGLYNNKSNVELRVFSKEMVDFISPRTWFFDWSAPFRMSSTLQKKELRTPY